jgi:hypothetical protein
MRAQTQTYPPHTHSFAVFSVNLASQISSLMTRLHPAYAAIVFYQARTSVREGIVTPNGATRRFIKFVPLTSVAPGIPIIGVVAHAQCGLGRQRVLDKWTKGRIRHWSNGWKLGWRGHRRFSGIGVSNQQSSELQLSKLNLRRF